MSTDIPLRVLVLEDRPVDAELILYEMKRSGYDCVGKRVDTQEDYLRAIEEIPDIILADYSLPQFTAMEALRLLQERGLDIPFIVVTGTISEEAAVETMIQGAADYLLKDRLGRLGQAVQRTLQQKALRDEKRKSEHALRLSEDKFSKAFRISPDAISISRISDGKYIEINEGFTRLTGFLPEDVIGNNNLLINIWANLDESQCFFADMQEHGEISNMEGVFKKSDGGLWIGLISARIIEVNEGACIISIIRDITERKRAELDLQHAHMDLAEAYEATIEGWSNVLDLRDKETEGHTQRVTEITVSLARALGIPEEQIVHIRRGALLHDIGKMAIPDGILQKPGPLTEDEWKEMRRHPEYAHHMLSPIIYLRSALDIPFCHHEHWDGTGYPRGLHGEEIPLSARIFSIVDVWDALLSNRPYRRGCTEESVLEYIQRHAGSYFDPRLVEAFLELHHKGVFKETQTDQMFHKNDISGQTLNGPIP
jgi:PAS domain S-box-containing protein/putative nucleotidyltransferase with HDIG domain